MMCNSTSHYHRAFRTRLGASFTAGLCVLLVAKRSWLSLGWALRERSRHTSYSIVLRLLLRRIEESCIVSAAISSHRDIV